MHDGLDGVNANATSLLMRSVVKSCPVSNSDNALMTTEQLRDLGDLSFTQLAELRHRGAFSTVSQTFATCCVRCNSGSEASSGILQEWYQVRVSFLSNLDTSNRTSRKRYSASKTKPLSTLAAQQVFLPSWSVS